MLVSKQHSGIYCAYFLQILVGLSSAGIPENSILFTTKSNIISYIKNTDDWLGGVVQEPIIEQIRGNMQTSSGLAYDSHLHTVLLSDPGENSIYLLNASSISGVVYHIGTSNGVGQLTVDWRAHNVYWADSVYGWIAMQSLPRDMRAHNSLQTNFTLVVEKHLHTPTGIVIHPHKYYLFWADAGPQPKIERSDLIGRDRQIIIWAGLITPTSLCIDQSNNRLYWTDPVRRTIEYSDFDGQNRNILVSNSQKEFYGLSIFKNTVIVTIPSRKLIETYDGTTGEKKSKHNSTDEAFYSTTVYSLEDQPKALQEGCDLLPCDQLCTHMEHDQGRSCLCNDGYELEYNGRDCFAETNVLERFILYTTNTAICRISINIINMDFNYLEPLCDVIKHNQTITKFTVDMGRSIIFYTDGKNLYKDTAFGQNPKHIGSAETVADLDYNWKSKELIWIDKSDGKIYAVNVEQDEVKQRVVLEDLNSPTSIAVDPHNRRIYWVSNEGLFPKLHVLEEDGSTSSLGTTSLNEPSDLEYDRFNERLVWSDERGHIGMINVDDSDEKKIDLHGGKPAALTVFKKYILYRDSQINTRFLSVIQEPDNSQWPVPNELFNTSYTSDIHVFDSSLQPSYLEPCEDNNGGCEHICLPQYNHMCACRLGYQLHPDGTSCTTTSINSSFYMVVDNMFNAIYQIDAHNNNSINAVEIEHDNEPTSLCYNANDNTVYWVDKKSHSVKMKRTYDTKEKSFGTDVSSTSNIAVDTTGGNIYVTKDDSILLFAPNNDVKTLIESENLKGNVGKIALAPSPGIMVWTESGAVTRIVKANMDGTTTKEVVTEDIETPSDIAIDQYVIGNILYWSDSSLHKIERVFLDFLQRQNVYHNQDLNIISVDVKDDYLFFLADGHRKIFRIHKLTGSGFRVMMESAYLGTISALYIWKPATPKHTHCGDCTNGGCSAICLPRSGGGRSCACADNIDLGPDSKTCINVDRCNDVISDTYIERLDQCCIPVSGNVCGYTCKLGYQNNTYPLYCQANGRWNLSLEDACTKIEAQAPSNSIGFYAGIGGGAAAILLLVVVGSILLCRRRNQKHKKPGRLPSISDVNHGERVNPGFRPYNDPVGILSPDQPRSLTDAERADGGEYQYIDDALMAKTVDLPPESSFKAAKGIDNSSEKSVRYSKFPPDGSGTRPSGSDYYLTVCPEPDYDHEYQTQIAKGSSATAVAARKFMDEDGYLQSSSFSRKEAGSYLSGPRMVERENWH